MESRGGNAPVSFNVIRRVSFLGDELSERFLKSNDSLVKLEDERGHDGAVSRCVLPTGRRHYLCEFE